MSILPAPPARPATSRRPRRRARAALGAALAAVGLVTLAGCMKVEMGFTLSEDDTVSGTVVMAISDEFAESLDMDPQEMWDMANEGEDGLTSELPEGSSQEPYADGEYTGVQVNYTDQPLDGIGTDEDLSITREGDEYVVEGVMDLSDESTGETAEMPAEILDSFLMRIAVTFPGAVGETNGTVDGNTVTWEPTMGERNEISARGSAVADGAATAEEATPTEEEATEGSAEEVAPQDADETADGMTGMDDAEDTAATDSGTPVWVFVLALVVGLAVLGTVITLVVRHNRTAAATATPVSSDPQDVFGQQPPTHQPGQPPVDPSGPHGPTDPSQGPR
ncbi:LppM family (lipo)protein [Isoptericola jiangsuensis]|uniref:LppM family (lipo)protein n=1 Tax=Isoptericola jiangsuensis TaxID=548579 RepID=UPI003AAC9830